MVDLTNSWIENLSGFQIAGLFGFLAYLSGFTLVQLRVLDGNSMVYSVISVVAATLVLVSLSENFNLASALIQIAWISIGSVGIALRIFRAHGGPRDARQL